MKNVDESYEYLAATRIEPQLHKLAKELTGARTAEDVEYVHQARVASRRLRSALQMFGGCFQPKKFKSWRNGVRDITKELGLARDLDVQVLFLEKKIAGLDDEEKKRYRAGLSRVLLRRQQKRKAIQPDVVKAIDTFESSGILEEMHAEVATVIFALGRKQCGFESPYVFSQSAKNIEKRINNLVAFDDCLEDAANVSQHHAMRIAAKRLRYTLEICAPAYGDELGTCIKSVKKLQSLLGDIHDCDVWAEQIEDFISNELARTIEYFGHTRPFALLRPGIEYLSTERKATRATLYEEVLAYWETLKKQNTLGSLLELVQSRISNSAEQEYQEMDEGLAEESLDAEDDVIPESEMETNEILTEEASDNIDEEEIQDESGVDRGCTRESSSPGSSPD